MRTFPFVWLDVFAEKSLEGNQLAVFTDATGLSDAEQQAIARETHLSETTFVFPRDGATEQEKGIRVRIYTVAEELPFAGHPTLGTAWQLHRTRGDTEVVLDLDVGKIPVSFDAAGLGEMRQRDPVLGTIVPADAVAQAVGVPLDWIDTDLPIQAVSTGLPFLIVPLRSLEAARNLRVDAGRIAAFLAGKDASHIYWVSRETTSDARLHARMIFYNGEDPATGSAAGCCISWAVRHGVVASGERIVIEQGIEMRRPSRIHARAERSGDTVTNVHVGGNVREVIRGELRLP